MTEKIEELLDRAFKAEKYGDRSEAIRIYREVADGESEHAEYASNCVANLEHLGISVSETDSKSEISDSISNNPFRSPSVPSHANSDLDSDYSNRRRNRLSSSIFRALTIFCLLTAIYNCFTMQFKLGYTHNMGWANWLVLTSIDYLTIIGLFAVAWLSSRYAAALHQLLPLSKSGFDTYVKRQLWFSIGLGVTAFLYVARELAIFWMPSRF